MNIRPQSFPPSVQRLLPLLHVDFEPPRPPSNSEVAIAAAVAIVLSLVVNAVVLIESQLNVATHWDWSPRQTIVTPHCSRRRHLVRLRDDRCDPALDRSIHRRGIPRSFPAGRRPPVTFESTRRVSTGSPLAGDSACAELRTASPE